MTAAALGGGGRRAHNLGFRSCFASLASVRATEIEASRAFSWRQVVCHRCRWSRESASNGSGINFLPL